jgi:putative FmdB family regulatory protein
MPVYTYRCTNCGFVFDQQQRFSDASLTRCPECSKKSLQKVFQPVGIVFKGSGFYATDHRSPSGQSSRAGGNSKTGEEGGEKSSSAVEEKGSTASSEVSHEKSSESSAKSGKSEE